MPSPRPALAYLLDRAPPSPELAAQLFAGQRAAGGRAPFWAPAYSSPDGTCSRLAQAESLGAGNRFRHPATKVQARLQQAGALVWHTDACRDVEVVTDGEPFWVRAGRPCAHAAGGYWPA